MDDSTACAPRRVFPRLPQCRERCAYFSGETWEPASSTRFIRSKIHRRSARFALAAARASFIRRTWPVASDPEALDSLAFNAAVPKLPSSLLMSEASVRERKPRVRRGGSWAVFSGRGDSVRAGRSQNPTAPADGYPGPGSCVRKRPQPPLQPTVCRSPATQFTCYRPQTGESDRNSADSISQISLIAERQKAMSYQLSECLSITPINYDAYR